MSEAVMQPGRKSTNGRSYYWHLAPLRGLFRVFGALAPNTAARVALILFRRPRRHPIPGRELQWMESAERFAVLVDGQRVAAWSWGEGPTVILVHGWEGRGSQMGAFAGPLVTAGFRVVTFDGPGHGISRGKLSSLPQFATALRKIADQVGPVHAVIAHSFGCPATAWAVGNGLDAQRLVFVAPPADLDEYIRFFSELIGLSSNVRHKMIARLENQFGIAWHDARVATLSPIASTALLVVHDRNDSDSEFSNGAKVAAAWRGSRLFATSGLGHRRILRNPAVVSEVVRSLD